eukprot:633930-Amphidinium_carterae.1
MSPRVRVPIIFVCFVCKSVGAADMKQSAQQDHFDTDLESLLVFAKQHVWRLLAGMSEVRDQVGSTSMLCPGLEFQVHYHCAAMGIQWSWVLNIAALDACEYLSFCKSTPGLAPSCAA